MGVISLKSLFISLRRKLIGMVVIIGAAGRMTLKSIEKSIT